MMMMNHFHKNFCDYLFVCIFKNVSCLQKNSLFNIQICKRDYNHNLPTFNGCKILYLGLE